MSPWTPWSRLSASPAALRIAFGVALPVGIGLAALLIAQISGAFRFWEGVGR